MAEENLSRFLKVVENFFPGRKVKTLFELGARDCTETLEFHRQLPEALIYAFECNPATLPLCRKHVRGKERITLVEKAVSDTEGSVSFFPIDPEQTETTWEDGNPGASSLLRASGKYPVEKYVQQEITVPTTTLETYLKEGRINGIDLLWMDIQGAELMALRGLGERIHEVGMIHAEVEFFEIYQGQPLFPEIKRFLRKKGFYLVGFTTFGEYSGDAVFVNRSLLGIGRRAIYALLDPFRYRLHRYGRYLSLRGLASLPATVVRAGAEAFRRHDIVRYYCRRGDRFSLGRLLFMGWLRWGRRFLGLDWDLWNPRDSKEPLDVVITALPKDGQTLPFVINGVRRMVRHPLGKIYIIAPKAGGFDRACAKIGAVFVDEASLLPITRDSIGYRVDGKDRNGWLFQQLLKFSASTLVETESYLVVDADTVLTRPQVFKDKKGRTVFSVSDEYHSPYRQAYHRLMGEDPRCPGSFVAHHMLFEKAVIKELFSALSRNGDAWYQVIVGALDKGEYSSFSEYETYGNFFLSRRRKKARLTYWYNQSRPASELARLDPGKELVDNRFRSLSFHVRG